MTAKTNEPKMNQAFMCGGWADTYTNNQTTRNEGNHFAKRLILSCLCLRVLPLTV
jgi:hypothetical protein